MNGESKTLDVTARVSTIGDLWISWSHESSVSHASQRILSSFSDRGIASLHTRVSCTTGQWKWEKELLSTSCLPHSGSSWTPEITCTAFTLERRLLFVQFTIANDDECIVQCAFVRVPDGRRRNFFFPHTDPHSPRHYVIYRVRLIFYHSLSLSVSQSAKKKVHSCGRLAILQDKWKENYRTILLLHIAWDVE